MQSMEYVDHRVVHGGGSVDSPWTGAQCYLLTHLHALFLAEQAGRKVKPIRIQSAVPN